MIKIMIIGVGYHARRIYLPYFMREIEETELSCGVDIHSQKDIIGAYLKKNNFKLEMYYISDLDQYKISKKLDKFLTNLIEKYKIDSVIISTEPLVHYKYAKWALRHNLNILMDKPVTAEKDLSTDIQKALKLKTDYCELKNIYLDKKKQGFIRAFSLMSQRRFHPAYILAKNKIKEVFDLTNCPITSIQISHSDGQWRMPSEIIEQNYHPYNQGYGKCSHSGYHSLDMINWFMDATLKKDKKIDNADVFSNFLRPKDFLAQINFDDYRKLFDNFDNFNKCSEEDFLRAVENFGEIDAFNSFVFKKNDRIMCLGSVNLIHNGFSQRNWVSAIGRDLYKGNGRVRQEFYFIEQGPFQSISLLSYQSEEINPDKNDGLYDFGGEYHFDIHIFRNSKMFKGWKSHEKISIKDLWENNMQGYSRGHQEDSRINCIEDFISSIKNNRESLSDIVSHERGTFLLSSIYQSAIKLRQGENSLVNIKFG